MQNEVSMPSEVIYFLDYSRTEFVFGKVCYDVLIGALDRETEDTEGKEHMHLLIRREQSDYFFIDCFVSLFPACQV